MFPRAHYDDYRESVSGLLLPLLLTTYLCGPFGFRGMDSGNVVLVGMFAVVLLVFGSTSRARAPLAQAG